LDSEQVEEPTYLLHYLHTICAFSQSVSILCTDNAQIV